MNKITHAFNHHIAGTLSFRTLCRSDAFPILDASKNPEFNARLIWGPPENLDEVLVEVDKLIAEQASGNAIVVSVCERDNGKWVGLYKFSKFEDSLCMGLWTHPDYWKSMAAFRCAESAVEIAFRSSELPHLYAAIVKGNRTMEKMLTTSGFIYQSDIPLKHSKGHDVLCDLFKLNRSDWTRKPKISTY